jgi:hypothetical protein
LYHKTRTQQINASPQDAAGHLFGPEVPFMAADAPRNGPGCAEFSQFHQTIKRGPGGRRFDLMVLFQN